MAIDIIRSGRVTMLANMCDLDDIYALSYILIAINKLGLPDNTISSIRRLRYTVISYTHTKLKSK